MTKEVILAFKHLDFNRHLDFDVWVFPWNLVLGIYPFVTWCLTMTFMSLFIQITIIAY
jgi:hypothetical protein